MSNRPFEIKKPDYNSSEFSINKDLAKNYDEWNFNSINQRCIELSNEALNIWKCDYIPSVEKLDSEYWITPIKDRENIKAEDSLEYLLEQNIYVLKDSTPGKNKIKPGDFICFYRTGKGIIADAQVTTFAKRNPKTVPLGYEEFPWILEVDKVRIYTDNPVFIDKKTYIQLEECKNAKEGYNLGLFVKRTHQITEEDFNLLNKG